MSQEYFDQRAIRDQAARDSFEKQRMVDLDVLIANTDDGSDRRVAPNKSHKRILPSVPRLQKRQRRQAALHG